MFENDARVVHCWSKPCHVTMSDANLGFLQMRFYSLHVFLLIPSVPRKEKQQLANPVREIHTGISWASS